MKKHKALIIATPATDAEGTSENSLNAAASAPVDPRNLPRKKKKKHFSALSALANFRSPTAAVNAHSYRDGGFGSTGTNLTYRDRRGLL